MDHNTHSLGDLVKAFLKSRGIDEKMQELDLDKDWEKLAGQVIAKHTKSLKLKNGVLTLFIDSAPLRHTLSFSKSELIARLNESLGKELIKDIDLR